ncbi:1-acylglycerol-3-phosphate O-acyltransferase PNPLA3 [Talpa occidentalis]|uniref:1-acylglycerol-3-phosphate O-acyltransferase PNPLA3 n=1 Tax=Talpa occidentalis TaxID=50954 RepID=UPI00188E6BEC|nr:1-acylglycerol-3-phosphate O-acyltransferase PNPLA3 [Talpa occidentalis]
MLDPERGWSLSFSGCGFLAIYYLGVCRCLAEHAPHVLRDARMMFGASSGSLLCAVLLSGLSFDQSVQIFMDLALWAQSPNLRIFRPSINLMEFMRAVLRQHLPDNIHERLSGKVYLSLTRVADWKNVLVSEFQSKEEVIDALLCSTFIPFYCGFIPPSFRGVDYVDGGLSNNSPYMDSRTTITVSPYYGENDIGPRNISMNLLAIDFNSLHMHACAENTCFMIWSLWPPSHKVLLEFCVQGYLDTVRFLEEKGICDRPQRSLSAPSEELQVLVPPQPQGVAAPEEKPGDELLAYLRCNIQQWDESFLQIMSPTFILALRHTMKETDGYLGKICNLLPVKVLSYALLSCMLLVELAFYVVWRLALWVPRIREDLPRLQGVASRAYSLLLMRQFHGAR